MNGYGVVHRSDPCVMELVSRLAREPWTDRPACVHPVLSAVARAVHDHSSSAGRRELLPLAPLFLDTASPGFEPSARLVALCVSTALAGGELAGDERRRLGAAHRTALHLLGTEEHPAGSARWWLPVLGHRSEAFYRTFVATEHAAEAVAVAARTANDVRLKSLLKLCLAAQPSPSCSASAQNSGS
ncbi:hypothetical protein EV645_4032 [Kribbella rubisoli]|uniref:Uncharacterized protein n=1 Tax=Kribbella rubisoli TaxID=3075929 RepID=A0A4Q7X2W6_9ACTN|nr:hypothetical protein EV645_4032 [Kribbella rubisoli]